MSLCLAAIDSPHYHEAVKVAVEVLQRTAGAAIHGSDTDEPQLQHTDACLTGRKGRQQLQQLGQRNTTGAAGEAEAAAGQLSDVREGVLLVGLQLLFDAAAGKASAGAARPLLQCSHWPVGRWVGGCTDE